MKTSIVVPLAVMLLMLSALVAQEKVGSPKPDNAAGASAKPLMVSGKVSGNGKTLVTDIDSEWMVSNADVLKGHEGRRVTVKCYVDTERNRIQILWVRKDEAESNYSARSMDSAFRR